MSDSTRGDADDERELLAITGIGPAVAGRLAGIGLGSVELLARASAEDLVERAAGWRFPPSLDRARIWIDEAKRLAGARSPVRRPPARARPPAHHETRPRVRHSFTLEVQTDDTDPGAAVAIRIVDVASQAFDTWSGWNPERIVRFVASKSGLATSPQETAATAVADTLPPAAETLWAYGVLDSPTLLPGGARTRVILTLGPDDVPAGPAQGTLEWDLAVGGAGGRATEQLARRHVLLAAGEPRVVDATVTVPAQYARARLVAVVRIMVPGAEPRLARRLSDSHLEVTSHLSRAEAG